MRELRIDLGSLSSLSQAKDHFEKKFISHKLQQFRGNVSQAALSLDMDRSNLYKKILRHGIEIPKGYGFRKENKGISRK